MLLESLNALILAGEDALHTSCGLSVCGHGVSLLRQGSLTFPALAVVQIRNGPLQKVHLGCDSRLSGHLAGLAAGDGAESGIEALAGRFTSQLLGGLDARNPRGTVQHLAAGPTNLVSRGRRSFGLRLETAAGQLFILSEVPSRMEMEIARGSDFMSAMQTGYLPRGWTHRNVIDSELGLENFLVFLRKAEADVVLEIPGEDDLSFVRSGVLLDNGTFDGVRGLKFCTDLSAAGQAGLAQGTEVRATVGVGDRSLQFTMPFLGGATHGLANGAELPCAFLLPPERVTIAQRRLAFRIPVRDAITVELFAGAEDASPWGDTPPDERPLFRGTLADLSFSGSRLVADESAASIALELNRRVTCRIHFADLDQPLSVLGVVRRSTSRLVDRNERQCEVGLEFLISQETDRAALDFIREFVLAEQRARLAQRIHVSGLQT